MTLTVCVNEPKGLFTPNDSIPVTITLTDFDGYCDGQNGLHTHFACQCNVCVNEP